MTDLTLIIMDYQCGKAECIYEYNNNYIYALYSKYDYTIVIRILTYQCYFCQFYIFTFFLVVEGLGSRFYLIVCLSVA